MGFLSGGDGQSVQAQQPAIASGLRIQSSVAGTPIPIVYGTNRVAGNLMWMGDFTATSAQASGGGKAGGKGGGSGGKSGSGAPVQVTYSASVIFGLAEGPIAGVGQVWANRTLYASPAAAGSYTILNGGYSQAAWSFLSSNHPGEALNYRGLAMSAAAGLQLGASPALPQYSWEILGILRYGAIASGAKTFSVQAETFTADVVNNLLLSIAHGLPGGQAVFLASTGTLPAPLAAGTAYFVTNPTANNLQLADFLYQFPPGGFFVGGTNLETVTDAGTGSHSLIAAAAVFNSTAHGFTEGLPVQLTTTGTLPGGLSLATTYFAVNVTANTYNLSTGVSTSGVPASVGGAGKIIGGTSNLSTAPLLSVTSLGSGTHTATPYVIDANPADLVADLLTNANYGAGFAGAQVGDLVTGAGSYANWCIANGLFLSPAIETQEAAGNILTRWAQLTISEIVWSEGKLKVIPRGDRAVTANGATYTPNLTPIYDLTDDSYMPAKGRAPLQLTRTDPANARNQLSVECLDRPNQYAIATPEWKDQGNIDLYGLRPTTGVFSAHEITSPAVGAFVAQLMGQKGLYVRNTYACKLPVIYCLLEAMDLVTLTDANLGLNRQLVRLTEVSEGAYDDGSIDITAEEVPIGVAAPALYGSSSFNGLNLNYNAQPGSINVPVIFEGPGALTVSGYGLWVAAAGSGVNWGGCQVWASTDGNSYEHVGDKFGPSRYGTLTASFALGADPDTTDSCAVDLTASAGALLSGTQLDADNLNTLCLVDTELFSYKTATLGAAYHYTLGAYLRRGAYNTDPAAHASGTGFIRLDGAIFDYEYPPSWAGKTIYLKFPSFNKWGLAVESLAGVPAYTHTIGASLGRPDNVTGFAIGQNGAVAVFQWNLLTAPNVAGYEIRYNPVTAAKPLDWGSATPLTQVTRGTQITTAKLPPGNWMCLICARDASLNYSRVPASAQINMGNTNTLVSTSQQAPDWLGPAWNFIRHPMGVLIPVSTKSANQLTNTELFEKFVPYPVAYCQYDSPEIDLAFDSPVRLHGEILSSLGRNVTTGVAAPAQLMDYRAVAGTYGGFQSWSIGTVTCRYFKERVTLAPLSVGDAFLSSCIPTADTLSSTLNVSNAAIAPGGTAIVFAQQFHAAPNVQATVIAATGLTAVVSGVTTTGCTVHVFNTSNSDVGGTVNLTISGV